MKKLSISLICVCACVTTSPAQTLESFIPEQTIIFQQAHGDLNKDSIDDAALILEFVGETLEGERPRSLLILFKDKNNQYTEACRASDAVLDGNTGGMNEDPFLSMEIKRNVLRIDYAGGASDKWQSTHRYRYQNEAFYVIGATLKNELHAVTETYDYNLSNGKIIITTKDVSNKANNKTVNRTHKIRLPLLRRFEPDAIWAILIPKDYAKVSDCKLEDYSLGDCAHLEFDCGDFGNASTYLDDASQQLWSDLMIETDEETSVNPEYKGRTFEITYGEQYGTRCEQEGEEKYQLVVGFRLKE
jgi:hypothetical protein